MRRVSGLGLFLGWAACSSGGSGGAPDAGAADAARADASGGSDAGTPVDCSADETGWTPLGEPLSAISGSTGAVSPRVAIAPLDGAPVVVWREADADGKRFAFVGRWTGTAWATLGGEITALPAAPAVLSPDVAFAGGELVVAFAESEGSEIFPHAFRWSGSAWEELGDRVADLDLTTGRLDVELRADGDPVVAFASVSSNQAHVFEWSGSGWVQLGAGVRGEDGILGPLSPDLELTSGGAPVVSWQEGSDVNYVRAWSGSAWIEVASGQYQANADGNPFAANLDLDGDDDPVVAWAESGSATNATATYVGAWGGSAWDLLAGPLSDDPDQGTNAVPGGFELDSAGRGTVVFGEASGGVEKVRVYRDAGDGYEPLGGGVLDAVAGDTSSGFRPTLAIDPCDRPVVAWQEEDAPGGTLRVHVWRYQSP